MLTKRARWLPVATLVAIALLGTMLQPVSLLAVTTADGQMLACRRLSRGEAVTLVFTHSMYGGEVRETWLPVGDQLARTSIETDLAAAAEYYATDGAVERTDGGFAVIVRPLSVDALLVRVDDIGDHRLRFTNSDEQSLAGQVNGSVGATITIQRHTMLQHAIAGCRT